MNAMTSTAAPGTGQERKAPGRPRNAQADEAILDAVLDLLSDGQSAAAISIEAVAARAGVGKATIYRRWPNKEALLIDAVRSMKGPLPEPAGVSVREDLIALIKANRTPRAQRYGKVTACLLPELIRDDELARMYQAFVEPRREVTRQVLRRGIETGELRADLDIEMTQLMLSAPGMIQSMLRLNLAVPEERFAETLVDAVLSGARA
ncbi:TetR/AcrR family transcriptional regulator [Actinoplanes sp. DH11]|uniref:TetR/AcrR family transcriptional regulator n=1 Tax=Actinoplanes sp. DH11 TaxID=2857011 RepID=UPI001E59C002|nr:TetR/AcrR family transcriptional regulator [Actinoplanes sp. DH11]